MREKTNQEKDAAEKQVSLLTTALSGASGSDGYWLNPSGRTIPKIYDKGPAVSPFNALILGLHADSNGYRIAHYTSFTEAQKRNEAILQGEKGVPFFWYRWDKYVNRHNPDDVISKQDYAELPTDKRQLYKGMRNREVRTLFNIEQTSLPMVDEKRYQELLTRYGTSNDRGNIEKEDKQLHTTVNKFAAQMKEYLIPIRKDTIGVAHYNTDKDAVYIPEQKHFAHYENYVQELMRQVVSATGHQQRLAREGMVMNGGKAPSEDAVKYEALIEELASGVKMMELGLPAKLSLDNQKYVEYWTRELKENPSMIDAVESDMNNAIEVIRKAEQGEKLEYATVRNQAVTAELKTEWNEQGNHYIADVVKGIPNAETKEMVVVKSNDKSVVDVVLPAGARAVKNELEGFEKAKITAALQAQGYEKVRFYNKDGATGYRPDDAYFEGKSVDIAKLHGEKLVEVSSLNTSDAVSRANQIQFERIQMLRDDNNRWTLYLKPTDKPGVAIYPDKDDLNRFFSTMKQGDQESVASIRNELAQKYYALASANPSLAVKLFNDTPDDVDKSKIERVSVYKTKEGQYMCAVKVNGLEDIKPREITPLQWQRIWVADNVNEYKTNLAAKIFANVLNGEMTMKNDFPNLKQVDELKAKHPDAIILIRRNNNYEAYREDADKVAKVCNLNKFDRVNADTDESVEMVSFPANALDTYLPKMIRHGDRIAICDMLEPQKTVPKQTEQKSEQEERSRGMRM